MRTLRTLGTVTWMTSGSRLDGRFPADVEPAILDLVSTYGRMFSSAVISSGPSSPMVTSTRPEPSSSSWVKSATVRFSVFATPSPKTVNSRDAEQPDAARQSAKMKPPSPFRKARMAHLRSGRSVRANSSVTARRRWCTLCGCGGGTASGAPKARRGSHGPRREATSDERRKVGAAAVRARARASGSAQRAMCMGCGRWNGCTWGRGRRLSDGSCGMAASRGQ
jgi:hypothetical protein